jgi:hypothetical protein
MTNRTPASRVGHGEKEAVHGDETNGHEEGGGAARRRRSNFFRLVREDT